MSVKQINSNFKMAMIVNLIFVGAALAHQGVKSLVVDGTVYVYHVLKTPFNRF
jgi:hypothetical protein